MRQDHTIYLKGKIDIDESPQVVAQLKPMMDQRPPVLHIDMKSVKAIDSTGLAVLIDANQRVQGYGGELVLIGVPPKVYRMMEIARLDQVFTIE